MRYAVRLMLVSLLLASGANAQVWPRPGSGDLRFQTVDYRPDQVVQLRVAPGFQLGVEFVPDEHIESVAIGDSTGWQVTPNERGNHLFIKVSRLSSPTNMTVITRSRSYLFDLLPLAGPIPDMPYKVRFTYPDQGGDTKAAAVAPAPDSLYRLSGNRSLRPAAISDDGVRTYIQWAAEAPIPAVYTVDESGRERLINGMMREGVFVIDAVSARLIFRIDKRKAQADRQLRSKGK